ncbi:MAG: RNA polymerase sigma factor [Deltaproteobacteria bacterium]|nr:RNA polymerase sigma factor [Deltaproteobacteria bacterium]
MPTTAWSDQPAEVALPQLMEEQGGRLYRLSLKLCKDAHDAEDLVQEIFLIAWKKWHQFKGDAEPTTWLYTIAARACARRRRKRAGEPQTIESLSELLPVPGEEIPDIASLHQGPLEDQLRRETREAVEQAIARLPVHFRMPLILKEIVELPISDVAAILGLKKATVKTRLHRARLLLRRELVKKLPLRRAPRPGHSRQLCFDLLAAKQDALDRDVPFQVNEADLCSRCAALLATLDLTRDTCQSLGEGELPSELHQALTVAFQGAESSSS